MISILDDTGSSFDIRLLEVLGDVNICIKVNVFFQTVVFKQESVKFHWIHKLPQWSWLGDKFKKSQI